MFGPIDQLQYTSYRGNQLDALTDAMNSASQLTMPDFHEKSTAQSGEYGYDANGNMIRDDNKGITSVVYNHMNLPTEINFGPNHKILYLYDANGRKLKKQVIHNAQSHHTDYSGAFQYEDGFLTLILTPEGRIVKHSSTYDPQYFLKDYLGNVRVVYHANPETGMVEVVQEDHYDPFGMKLGGLGYVSDIESKYLFQGKEFNDEAIDTDSDGNTDTYMNWYDFEARQFDPQIGRWHVADPLAQYPSPYVGMGNNPVSLVDPNGMATIWSLEEETTLWYTMAIDSRIHSRHVSYNNSEPLHTAYTEELISRRGAIEISGGGACGDWKAEKLALFYYTQELRRWKAVMDKIYAYLNQPLPDFYSGPINCNIIGAGSTGSEAMDELAMMIQNASTTGLSFGGPKGKGKGTQGGGSNLPSFETLWSNYPHDINGEHQHPSKDPYAKNQCAIRVGVALQLSGIDMSSYPSSNNTSEGYPRSSKGLADWLWREYGKPTIISQSTFESDYWNKTGIIYIAPPVGGIGHIDLFNKGTTGSGYYLGSEIWFWNIK